MEIRDLWLQREVADGRLQVEKLLGVENPEDLMTKILTIREIHARLVKIGIVMEYYDRYMR